MRPCVKAQSNKEQDSIQLYKSYPVNKEQDKQTGQFSSERQRGFTLISTTEISEKKRIPKVPLIVVLFTIKGKIFGHRT